MAFQFTSERVTLLSKYADYQTLNYVK